MGTVNQKVLNRSLWKSSNVIKGNIEKMFFKMLYIKIKQETGKHSGYLSPQFNVFFRKADVTKA